MNSDNPTNEANHETTHRDEHAVQAYVSDMLALERHIAQPLSRQCSFEAAAEYGDALALIRRVKVLTDAHIAALAQALEARGGDGASGVKSAWSTLLGAGAAAVDSMRKTRVSKSLRDDYTALGLATMGYTMLDATALALGDGPIANLAKQHLTDYAAMVMEISEAMPDIVLQELRDTGVAVDVTISSAARQDTLDAWRQVARQRP